MITALEADVTCESVGTQTHFHEERAYELVNISVPANVVGTNNRFPAPNPFDRTVETWARSGYFIHGKDVTVQFPRNAALFPGVDQSAELDSIVAYRDDGTVTVCAFYPTDDDEALSVVWDVERDEWAGEMRTFDHGYLVDLNRTYPDPVWSVRHGV
jgi:hypothetical protein